VTPAAVAPQPGGRSVSLVLGAGGARGLAHVGAIEVLVERGYRIELIAGSSMGALVGGIHAAGKLAAYRAWALTLQRLDVLKLVDWTLTGGGFIKGDRVIAALRELVGDVDIEALPIAFTAVATDLEREQEVWISRGPLFAAIQASIAIPGLLRPQALGGRLLVDGGLLNPLPIAPALHAMTDMTIAVDVNGPVRRLPAAAVAPPAPAAAPPPGYAQRMAALFEGLIEAREERPAEPGWRDLMSRSLETMQRQLTRFHLSVHEPDLLIRIPRNACAFYEFHRAAELIAVGRDRATRALDRFEQKSTRDGEHGTVSNL
jgi:NTE family protein